MQIARNRTMATLIALFLMFAMAISFVALPTATSQVPYVSVGTRKTYAFIGAHPNPVGVGQRVLLHFGISHQTAGVAIGWEGLTITVTRPDNKIETLGPLRTDATGGSSMWYVPAMVGTYYLQTNFPEQRMVATAAGTPVNTTMLASTSEKLALVVQQEPLTYWPGVPLPAEYWTRPINAQLWEWSPIAGDWVEPRGFFVSTYTPNNEDAPETAHILWAKPLAGGGLAGGDFGNLQYETGGAYEDKFKFSVIINGILYYNKYESRGDPYAEQRVVAVDLHTGEELWDKPLIGRTGTTTGATVPAADRVIDGKSDQFPDGIGRRLAFGQTFYWCSYNYMGVFGYLWTTIGTTWMAFDAFTGRWIYTITDVPSGTNIFGPKGEIYRYTSSLTAGWFGLWNSSAIVSMEGSWRPHGNVYNASGRTAGVLAASNARAWTNITIPKGLPGSIQAVALDDKVFGAEVTWTAVSSWAISLVKGQEGYLLFNKTWKPPAEWATANRTSSVRIAEVSLQDGVFTVVNVDTRQHWGFSTETGEYLWGPTAPQHYLEMYQEAMAIIAYGRYLCGSTSGITYCYNVTTGELLWTYEAKDIYHESPLGNFPLRAPAALVVDGKLYGGYGEHSPNDPQPRGAPFFCIDIETGKEIWSQYMSICSYSYTPLIGDSIIATLNVFDNRIYAIGKGPSATTVTASPKVSEHGSSVLVEGMVTDISPGTQEYALTARFPNGVPAVSDANMSEWMRYVYNQFPRPADAVGVDVILSVLDPNNNYYEVGRTTSDASGFFSCTFTPEVPGKYTIIATFPGSKSYYGSFAETAINVGEAPPATPPPEYPVPVDYTLPIVAATIVLLIAIAIIGILLLRKR